MQKVTLLSVTKEIVSTRGVAYDSSSIPACAEIFLLKKGFVQRKKYGAGRKYTGLVATYKAWRAVNA